MKLWRQRQKLFSLSKDLVWSLWDILKHLLLKFNWFLCSQMSVIRFTVSLVLLQIPLFVWNVLPHSKKEYVWVLVVLDTSLILKDSAKVIYFFTLECHPSCSQCDAYGRTECIACPGDRVLTDTSCYCSDYDTGRECVANPTLEYPNYESTTKLLHSLLP